MVVQPQYRKIAEAVLALALWLVTFWLGLQCLYAIRDLVSLLSISLGGETKLVESFAPWLMLILGFVLVVFIIGTGEYHRQRVGQTISWRLFGWSIAVEVSILIIYKIL